MRRFLAQRRFNYIDTCGHAISTAMVASTGSLWWSLLVIPVIIISAIVEGNR